jgi:hypothetical protein
MPESRAVRPKWLPLTVGLLFAIIGLAGVASSVPQFDKFAIRQWIEPRPSAPAELFSGFDPGYTALFCMAVFTLGVGIAASPFLGLQGRRNLSLALTVLWYALGTVTGAWFLKLAPRPLSFTPLLAIGVFAWLGLFPLALGISKDWHQGRLNSAVWNAWLGAIPGAVVVGIVGFGIDLVRFGILGHDKLNGFAAPGWIVGILAGGFVVAAAFFAWGWFATPSSQADR